MDKIWIGPVVLVLFFGLAAYINHRRRTRWRGDSVDYGSQAAVNSPQPLRYLPNPRVRGSMTNYLLLATLPVAIALAPLGFWIGTTDLQRYSAGTPTRATVTYCGVGSHSHCEATWSIGGVSQTGVINGGFWDGADRVGSSLDVRVNNDEAYTMRSVPVGFVLGGGSVVVSIGLLAALVWRHVRTRRALSALTVSRGG